MILYNRVVLGSKVAAALLVVIPEAKGEFGQRMLSSFPEYLMQTEKITNLQCPSASLIKRGRSGRVPNRGSCVDHLR